MKFKLFASLCLLLTAIYISVPKSAEASLENFCARKRGTLYKSYKCPKTKITLPIKTCEYRNFWGQLHFVNGCSGPTGKYGKQIFNACLKHDLCYHHEPATHGLTRKECDNKFLDDAKRGCRSLASEDEEKCTRVAKAMHTALKVIGGAAYRCENVAARY